MTGDRHFMRRALRLAESGWGRVQPNPMVGAIVVQGETVVGQGSHLEFGGPHAEIVALAQAGEQARGATLYVSLEPCAHHGKTPPCIEAILAAGISRVVFAAADPNPEARGGGALLAARGVHVDSGILTEEERRLNAAFHHVHEHGSTFVALKLALSLDARLSQHTGRPSAVTGEAARQEVHRLRAGYDAILVGRGTAEADDPLLTARGSVRPRVPLIRIVLDTHASLRPDARLLRTIDEAPLWVLAGADAPAERTAALAQAGAVVQRIGTTHGSVDIGLALALLWRERVRSILCEGGGKLAASLLEADLVQRMYLFHAPLLLGPAGPPAFPLRRESQGWTLVQTARYGADTMLLLDRESGR